MVASTEIAHAKTAKNWAWKLNPMEEDRFDQWLDDAALSAEQRAEIEAEKELFADFRLFHEENWDLATNMTPQDFQDFLREERESEEDEDA